MSPPFPEPEVAIPSAVLPSAAHRRDIDGLRAVAVLPVILFHAGLPAFAGGYLGVDVFFVISGFLITGILARDLERGRFSLARFYERRARRILPALTAVLGACLVPALAWLSPNELRLFAESFLATALSVSNILFWQQLDYFGPVAERLPLLHTWSLGIEEQFYLLFPLLLLWLWRRGRALAGVLVLLAASLALAVWLAPRAPSATFFLLPTRAWELLAGGALALAAARVPRSGPAAATGLAAIVAAMAAVPLGLLPGVLPLVLACTGTVLVLGCASPEGLAGRLLSHPAPVGIGLVSYSAYLWHQPLLAFARIRFGHLDPAVAVGLGALALLLAWPTWAFVERPFRRPGTTGPARPLMVAAASLAILSLIGVGGIVTDGLAFRVPPPIRAIMASVRDVNPYRDTCKTGFDQPNPVHPVAGCTLEGTDPAVLFWGDSHADALQGAMFAAAGDAGLRFYSVTRSACPPAPGLTRTAGASADCDAFNRGVEAYAAAAGYPVVVLAARWISGAAPGPFDNGEGGIDNPPGDWLTPLGSAPADAAEREAMVIARYVAAVESLLERGFQVVLVYPVPEAGWNVPEELARRRAGSEAPVTLTTPVAAFAARQAPVLAAFDAIASPNLHRARPASVLCDTPPLPGRCLNSLGDQPLYFDENHLNNTGARMVAPEIMRAIDEARSAAG